MSYLQTRVLSHGQRVCKLYKQTLRQLESYYGDKRYWYRYNCVLMRARFDENKDVKDLRVAKKLLEDGERELFLNQHVQPVKFPNSPGGVAYGREPPVPDWIYDTWAPLEKAQYPEYFARREKRKQEYIERWEKQYGKPQLDGAH
ncbi:NADH dehydrogenase [ubiquinone] 1 beta subcomplex subunit 9-like [Liolophura sinensis]|uniref:NADH dehydrogenase [ubiquinone] 1 beta subcomplex subunit 9-like n=1 Tax=Liolophura sinensis TaxID=3198878 RepID=UPI0031580F5A